MTTSTTLIKRGFRPFILDGKLLFFNRDTGVNILLDGDETAHLRQCAPRTLLLAITNACNLTCNFCYRDLTSESAWTYDTLLTFCRDADDWGVLEIAFGGGEPLVFRRFDELINELYSSTRLCLNFTTNGTLLTRAFLKSIDGKYGMIRVSLYNDNRFDRTIDLLAEENIRFGVNWMITPSVLPQLDRTFLDLIAAGVRDFLFISYKGHDRSLHLNEAGRAQLSNFITRNHNLFGKSLSLKVDVCWRDDLSGIPRLFYEEDCGAGNSFVSITSDKCVKQCSFQQTEIRMSAVEDVRKWWEANRKRNIPANVPGCARLPQRGLRDGYESLRIQSIQQ